MQTTQNRTENMSLLTAPSIIAASPQFITPVEPTTMQDALDKSGVQGESWKALADERARLLLKALDVNAQLIDSAIAREDILSEQEVVLSHQTSILTLMTEFINKHIEEGTIDPQLAELADKITSSTAYASAAWMSDKSGTE